MTPCPSCGRLTTALYCCAACGPDTSLDVPSRPTTHTQTCDERHAQRAATRMWTASKEGNNWIVRSPDGIRTGNFWDRWREAKRYAEEMNRQKTQLHKQEER